MDVEQRIIRVLEIQDGKALFIEWLNTLDKSVRPIIYRRIMRLRLGHFGKWRSVGEGVFELKIDKGPGYRVYYALHDSELVILLLGGVKKTQQVDIKTAQQLWRQARDENERFKRGFA